MILLIFSTFLLACRPTLYVPESSNAVKQQQLLEGRKLYVSHCSSCHNLHFPAEYDRKRWDIQLEKMQYRARINDKEMHLIYDYLTSEH